MLLMRRWPAEDVLWQTVSENRSESLAIAVTVDTATSVSVNSMSRSMLKESRVRATCQLNKMAPPPRAIPTSHRGVSDATR